MWFLNGGSLVPYQSNQLRKNVADLVGNPSLATGIGLVARFAGFRLELTYSVPLRVTVTDLTKTGFQFGIGANFL
jgi:hypothetical protein